MHIAFGAHRFYGLDGLTYQVDMKRLWVNFYRRLLTMRKFFAPMLIVAVAMMGVVATPKEGSALPSFARQMNLPCFGCHFQHIPKLNAFGRAFKMGGYTDSATALIEDENLSLPANLPISAILKYRYQTSTAKTSGDPKSGTERGEWQFPDEFALWAAGRAGKNVGYAFEGADAMSGKVVFVGDFGDIKAGIVPYHTDAGGPWWGMEIFNTGVFRMNRSFESRKETSIAQKMGFDGEATGLTGYAGSSMFFAAVGLWGPAVGAPDTGFDLSTVYRAAVTPTLGGFDTMVGVFGYAGKTKCVNCGSVGPMDGMSSSGNGTGSLQEFKTESFGVDAQAQGELGGMTLEVQAQYVDISASDVLQKKGNGWSVLAELGITKAVGVQAAQSSYTDKSGSADKTTDATTLGIFWNIAQNVTLRPEYSIYSGDGRSNDNAMTVMLFAGF